MISDYSLNDFPGYDHTEWTIKRVDTANAYAATGEKTKIIAVITGIFLATLTVSYCASARDHSFDACTYNYHQCFSFCHRRRC